MLFDWERFGRGSPAIDLAPLIPNLGTLADYKHVIKNYREVSHSLTDEQLLKQIILAKAWIVIEVINLFIDRPKSDPQVHLNWYNNHLPNWLDEMEKYLL
ncbi:hypothetical protein [Endozoicomonas arenosclerae]|uniref:hypothetical protein n=1 Tax=Endozoicomonas arenosclerae TaxID=1633495 RepID=UPI0007826A0B|nr:hypothetical protein [Endozoicomonas arenosclerae]